MMCVHRCKYNHFPTVWLSSKEGMTVMPGGVSFNRYWLMVADLQAYRQAWLEGALDQRRTVVRLPSNPLSGGPWSSYPGRHAIWDPENQKIGLHALTRACMPSVLAR